jgi:threonine aldolase
MDTIADLRSDTVTQPTPGMRDAMMRAPVGDDVFGDDPSVRELEEKCARLLGMEGAVYCPSGTMTNQIGISILTRPYDEILCYRGAHIYKHEGGGLAGNSGLSVRLLDGDRGRLTIDELAANINDKNDTHQPLTTVVALENTVVREAGSYYTSKQVATVSDWARSKGLKMHLDGARLFNALAETGDKPSDYGKYFDTISICLSKGLGAPVGSVLLCSKELEYKARRMRKVFGGGMRQAGFIAAAGSYAIDNHINRLKEDHIRARKLAEVIKGLKWVESLMPVDTNIVIFRISERLTPDTVLKGLAAQGVRAVKFTAREIRMVTHLDFDDEKLNHTIEVLKQVSFQHG